jgi:hypothetical protein
MARNYIDFISAYCDRWCERCAFTARCSAFATQAAIAMCGDFDEGLELAVGRPYPADGSPLPGLPAWLAEYDNGELTPAEAADWDRCLKARRARVEETAIMKVAWAFTRLSHVWLQSSGDTVRASADEVLQEALTIAAHDAVFITVKLSRALHGRDEYEHGEATEDHPVQNDWNGSAKVALISIERSESAWRTIAHATGEDTPGVLADQLRDLRVEVEKSFPGAWSFVRPGFDDAAGSGSAQR